MPIPRRVEKVWYRSRTLWINAITFLVSLLAFLMGNELIAEHPSTVAAIGMVVGVLNVVLRFLTGQPITISEDL